MRVGKQFIICSIILQIATGVVGVPARQSTRQALVTRMPADLKILYDEHRYVELRNALRKGQGPALYSGVLAAAFNQSSEAERLLRSIIKSAPRSGQSAEAFAALTHLYLQTGQYQSLASIVEQRLANFPERVEALQQEKAALAPFLDLPNQVNDQPRRVELRHDGGLFIPLAVNGKLSNFFIDTGAAINAMSESEAKRLGLQIHDQAGRIGTVTGQQAAFRTGVARVLTVGQIHLRNVSFAIFPDDQEPWVNLAAGRRGLLGIPVLLALRCLRWSRDGTVRFGEYSSQKAPSASDIYFDNDHLLITAGFKQKPVLFTLDTGAESTDLYEKFAMEYPDVVKETSRKDTTEVRGISGSESFSSVTLPELRFTVGSFETLLRPAHILMKQPGPLNCVGNLGFDLLRQVQAFSIDFRTMTLTLENKQ